MIQARRHPLPRSRHARRVDPGRLHRDPVLLRPKQKGGKGPLLMVAGGLLFVAYINNSFGVASALDDFFSGIDHTAHAHETVVIAWYLRALPALGVLIAASLMWVMATRAGLFRRRRKTQTAGADGACTIHEFAEICRGAGLGAKVARESYRMLLPQHRARMRTVLGAELGGELGMAPAAIVEFYAELLRRTDRPASESRIIPFSTVSTVQDVLQAVDIREDLTLADGRLNGRVAVRVEDLRREMGARRVMGGER